MITQNNDALILANEQKVQLLRRDLQVYNGETVHAKRLLADSNAVSGWQPFPKFLTNTKAISNIKINHKRWFCIRVPPLS